MTFRLAALGAVLLALGCASQQPAKEPMSDPAKAEASPLPEDPRAWLEEVEGERALAAVKAWNERSLAILQGDPRFSQLEAEALAIVNAKDKIPYGAYRAGMVYNFWQDETHVRGVLRRASLASYLAEEPDWESLLSVDALAEKEGENWVYKGSSCLPPAYQRCILTLSRGGKDASERREWSHETKSFVEGGFFLPEAKAGVTWKNENTLIVATDWGAGTLTESGYPFIVKELGRGQKLEAAREIIRGEAKDVGVFTGSLEGEDGRREMIAVRAITFYESEYFWLPEGETPVKLPLPRKVSPRDLFKGKAVFTIEEDWTPVTGGPTYPKGALLAFDWEAFTKSRALPAIETIYVPDARSSIEGVAASKSKLLVTVYENVIGRAYAYDVVNGAWKRAAVALPGAGSVGVASAYRDSDTVFFNQESFIAPDTLFLADMAKGGAPKPVKSAPARFDAKGLVVNQHEAVSKDGVKIPYFVVHRKDIALDGENPTLLYGYGGFQVSLTPSYSGLRGKLWLERGGVYVLANIRGGGEFGPAWHQAGLKTNRQVIYDDFIAVAEDLIARKITKPDRLGIEGGSNGGLLMGVMYTQRPDLFGAVICQVPLLDMLRYHKLLAGASWVGEYGDPDTPEERVFLQTISPYHNVMRGKAYPEMFFVTSSKDDRVHPGHARKMAKLLEEEGIAFLYYENIDGGHSAAANLKETAKRYALQHVYLMRKLMDRPAE